LHGLLNQHFSDTVAPNFRAQLLPTTIK